MTTFFSTFIAFASVSFLFFTAVSNSSAQTGGVLRTASPGSPTANYGCPVCNELPEDAKVYETDNRTVLATFSGGRLSGHGTISCSGFGGYVSFAQENSCPLRHLNTITVTFKRPVNFSSVWIDGEYGKSITVTLNNLQSVTLPFMRNPYDINLGQRPVSWYDFPGATGLVPVTSVKITSNDPNWKMAVNQVSFRYNPNGYGGGGGNEPPSKTPVIFIPGIGGSKLREKSTGTIKWLPSQLITLPTNPFDLSSLSLNPDNNTLDVPDVLRAESFAGMQPPTPYYISLLDYLTRNGGYKEYNVANDPSKRTLSGCDISQNSTDVNQKPVLFVFAYDWRKSNTENSIALKDYVECVKRFYPDKKINIVAHSMGGLLARRYILDNSGTHYVDKLITIASPWLGAPRAIHVLETGSFLAGAFDETRIIDFYTAQKIRQLAEFFPGQHELLPSNKYFQLVRESPFAVSYPWSHTIALNYEQTKGWLNGLHSQSTPATTGENFHTVQQDDWRNDATGVKYFHIYGKQRSNKTVGRVRVEYYTLCFPYEIDCRFTTRYRPFPTEGDGTVPLVSSSRISSVYNLDLNYRAQTQNEPFRFFIEPNAEETDADTEHNGLTRNARVLSKVIDLLKDESSNSNIAFIEKNKEGVSETGSNLITPDDDLPKSSEPSYYVTLTNVEEFQTGENSYPNFAGLFGQSNGVATQPIGEKSVWIAASANESRTISFRNDGTPMEVEIIKGTDYENATNLIRYSDLVIPANALIELTIAPNGNCQLRYDADGDGQTETIVNPSVSTAGTAARDLNPPNLSSIFREQGTVQTITLSAIDDESGVRQIRYSFDGRHFSPYTEPITFNTAQNAVIYAFAEDNNRNRTGIINFNVPTQGVVPVLECVQPSANGILTAHFGYENLNDVSVSIPTGGHNKFTPAPQDKGQPVVFQPGRQENVFTVQFNNHPITWSVKGADNVRRRVTASSSSPRCQ